jgi:hypothetical protein
MGAAAIGFCLDPKILADRKLAAPIPVPSPEVFQGGRVDRRRANRRGAGALRRTHPRHLHRDQVPRPRGVGNLACSVRRRCHVVTRWPPPVAPRSSARCQQPARRCALSPRRVPTSTCQRDQSTTGRAGCRTRHDRGRDGRGCRVAKGKIRNSGAGYRVRHRNAAPLSARVSTWSLSWRSSTKSVSNIDLGLARTLPRGGKPARLCCNRLTRAVSF